MKNYGQRFRIFVSALLVAGASSVCAAEIVHYPLPESDTDVRFVYPLKLLELVLKKSNGNYLLVPGKTVMQQKRALAELEAESPDLQIMWSMTTIEREAKLLPIRIPIDKGLLGWRISLVMKNNADLFRQVKTIADLDPYEAGQEVYWPDFEIFQYNKLKVVGTSYYDSTFKMLENNRFQYFPRSILEISAEMLLHKSEGVVIEKHIAFHYPAASYFFVNKKNRELAENVRTGLERALKDGSFDSLFKEYHNIASLNSMLSGRTIIELHNPLLPEETPIARKEYWYVPN